MYQDAVAPALDLTFDTPTAPDETILCCAGRITSETSALLVSTVRLLIPESKRIVLDLTKVDYIDSSGIGALVSLLVSTKRANCEFRVIKLSERIKDILRISNLSKILEGDQDYFGL